MMNKVQHMKKQIKRYKRNKRYLSSVLDESEENFKDAEVSSMWEEDSLFGSLRTQRLSQGTEPDSDSEIKGRFEHKSALSSIQPLLQAHGRRSVEAEAKTLKDSSAPKKPTNVFLIFCTAQRPVLKELYFKEHNEEISHHELTKTLAQTWNSLSLEEKKIYYEMYEKEKGRYEQEMSSYKPNPEPEIEAAVNSKSLVPSNH